MNWAERYEEWKASKGNRRLDILIDNIPSWRLLQELKQRGALVMAGDEDEDTGRTKGGKGMLRLGARPVDRNGLPLYRVPAEYIDALEGEN